MKLGQKHSIETKLKMRISMKGIRSLAKHPAWLGEKAGYDAKHDWAREHLQLTNQCQLCNSEENLTWANLSEKYQRISKDWIKLCCSCHMKFDSGKIALKINGKVFQRELSYFTRAKRKDSSSPYKGVFYKSGSGRRKRWMAQIVINRKPIRLGVYFTPEEAKMAYEKAAKTLVPKPEVFEI